ncbi:MAG: Twin-arginine translocation pathway signal [Rhodobacteraceae bacterium]|nr:Twin-arginine translocation pathway signal [Paracoccaceae bacterium]
MRVLNKQEAISRRGFLTGAGGMALITASGAVLSPSQGWAVEVKALKPETMATLIQMARDIYPHDRLADKFYAKAVKTHDETAAKDSAHKQLIEDGVAYIDSRTEVRHKVAGYRALGWEADRAAMLRLIEDQAFFQALRGGLVVGLYNQKEIWPMFGYEGASADQGGYIERGFDDLDWV